MKKLLPLVLTCLLLSSSLQAQCLIKEVPLFADTIQRLYFGESTSAELLAVRSGTTVDCFSNHFATMDLDGNIVDQVKLREENILRMVTDFDSTELFTYSEVAHGYDFVIQFNRYKLDHHNKVLTRQNLYYKSFYYPLFSYILSPELHINSGEKLAVFLGNNGILNGFTWDEETTTATNFLAVVNPIGSMKWSGLITHVAENDTLFYNYRHDRIVVMRKSDLQEPFDVFPGNGIRQILDTGEGLMIFETNNIRYVDYDMQPLNEWSHTFSGNFLARQLRDSILILEMKDEMLLLSSLDIESGDLNEIFKMPHRKIEITDFQLHGNRLFLLGHHQKQGMMQVLQLDCDGQTVPDRANTQLKSVRQVSDSNFQELHFVIENMGSDTLVGGNILFHFSDPHCGGYSFSVPFLDTLYPHSETVWKLNSVDFFNQYFISFYFINGDFFLLGPGERIIENMALNRISEIEIISHIDSGHETAADAKLIFYPNPARSGATINVLGDSLTASQWTLFNQLGQIVKHGDWNGLDIEAPSSPGMYFILIGTEFYKILVVE